MPVTGIQEKRKRGGDRPKQKELGGGGVERANRAALDCQANWYYTSRRTRPGTPPELLAALFSLLVVFGSLDVGSQTASSEIR
jgi:hypothetical protein